MKFAFNPEAEFETSLVDRCIEGGLVVEIHPHSGGKPKDYEIRERIDGLRVLRAQEWIDDVDVDTATGAIVEIPTDSIDLIYIH